MTKQALARMAASKEDAAQLLADHIVAALQNHWEACEQRNEMRPFTLQLTTNCDDYTAALAIKHCARWTDQNGNTLVADYVWMDSEQPDLLNYAEDIAALGIVGGLVAAAATVITPALIPLMLLEASVTLPMFASRKEVQRSIIFAPSTVRAYIRTPVRVYNVAGGYVTTAFTTVGNVATSATGLAAMVKTTAGQGVEASLGFAKNLFGKKP